MAIEFFSKEGLGAHSHSDPVCTTHLALTLEKASLCQTPCPKKPSETSGFRTRSHTQENLTCLHFLCVCLWQDRVVVMTAWCEVGLESHTQMVLGKWQPYDLLMFAQWVSGKGCIQPQAQDIRVHALPAPTAATSGSQTEPGEKAQDPKASRCRNKSEMLTKKKQHWQNTNFTESSISSILTQILKFPRIDRNHMGNQFNMGKTDGKIKMRHW